LPPGDRPRRLTDVNRRRVLRAAALAGTLGGAPSSIHAVVTGRDLLASTRAAGELLVPASSSRRLLLLAGVTSHGLLSLAWSAVLLAVLPRRHAVLAGGLGGLSIAGLDLSLAPRLAPGVAALPRLPQVADHVAFGAIVGWVSTQR
jgi:hypothetical protein